MRLGFDVQNRLSFYPLDTNQDSESLQYKDRTEMLPY